MFEPYLSFMLFLLFCCFSLALLVLKFWILIFVTKVTKTCKLWNINITCDEQRFNFKSWHVIFVVMLSVTKKFFHSENSVNQSIYHLRSQNWSLVKHSINQKDGRLSDILILSRNAGCRGFSCTLWISVG
jgi:hypothetical protein